MISLNDGSMVNCTVTGNLVTEESKFPHRGGMNILTAMAWEKKENLLLAGDAGGSLHFYHFKAQKTRAVATTYGEVKQVKFCPSRTQPRYFLALFSEGLGVWEGDQSEPISFIPFSAPKEGEKDNRVIMIDWVGPESPLCAMYDGSLRVTDLQLRQSTSSFLSYPQSEKIPSPHILSYRETLIFKTLLQHQPWNEKYSLTAVSGDFSSSEDLIALMAAQQFDLLPSKFVNTALNLQGTTNQMGKTFGDDKSMFGGGFYGTKCQLIIPSITAHRCLLTAEYLGDKTEIDFWRLVMYYMNHCDEDEEDPLSKSSAQEKEKEEKEKEKEKNRDKSIREITKRKDDFIFGDLDNSNLLDEKNPKSNSSLRDSFHLPSFSPVKTPSSNRRGTSKNFDYPETDVISKSKTLIPQETATGKLPDSIKTLPLYFDVVCDTVEVRHQQLELAALHESISTTYDQTQRAIQQNVYLGQHERAIQLLLETPSNTPNFKADALKACLIAALKSPDALKNTIKLVATNFIANTELFEGVQLLSLIGNGLEACTYLQAYGHWQTAAILAKSTLKKREREIVLRRWADNLQKIGELEKAIQIDVSLRDYHEVLQSFLGYGFYEQAALFLEVCQEHDLPILKTGQFKTMAFTVWNSYAKYLQELGFDKAVHYYEALAQKVQQELQDEHKSIFGAQGQ